MRLVPTIFEGETVATKNELADFILDDLILTSKSMDLIHIAKFMLETSKLSLQSKI